MEEKIGEVLQGKELMKSFHDANEWLREQRRYANEYEKCLGRILNRYSGCSAIVHGD